MRSSNIRLLAIVLSAVLLAAFVPAASAQNAAPVWLTPEDLPAGFSGSAMTPAQAGFVPLPSLGVEGQYFFTNAAGEMIMGWTIAPRNPLVQSVLLGIMPTGNFDASMAMAAGASSMMATNMIADALEQAGVPGGPVKGALPMPVKDWKAVGERGGALAIDIRVGTQIMTAEMAMVQRGPLVGGLLVIYPKGAKPSTGVAALAQKLDVRYQAALKAGAIAGAAAAAPIALEALDGKTAKDFAAQKADTFTVYTPKSWSVVPVALKTWGLDTWLKLKPADLVSLIFGMVSGLGAPVTPELLAKQGLDEATLEQSLATGVQAVEALEGYAPVFAKLWTVEGAAKNSLPQMVVGQFAAQSYGAPGDFIQLISDAANTASVKSVTLRSNMTVAGKPAANVVLDASAWGMPMQGSVYFIQNEKGGFIWTVVVFLTDNIKRDGETFDTVVRTLTVP